MSEADFRISFRWTLSLVTFFLWDRDLGSNYLLTRMPLMLAGLFESTPCKWPSISKTNTLDQDLPTRTIPHRLATQHSEILPLVHEIVANGEKMSTSIHDRGPGRLLAHGLGRCTGPALGPFQHFA